MWEATAPSHSSPRDVLTAPLPAAACAKGKENACGGGGGGADCAVMPSLLTQGKMALLSEVSTGKSFQRITRPFFFLVLFFPFTSIPIEKL